MSRIIEKVLSRGAEPFEFTLESSGTDEEEFNLDDGVYRGEEGYFDNKTLYITGLVIEPKDAATIEHLNIDGRTVVHQDSWEGGLDTDDAVEINGQGDNPDMESAFMGPIPVRMNIGLKASAGDGADLYIRGWTLEQDSEIAEAE